MTEITQTLQKLGLEEQEVKTYLALLDLGESTATKLAERTGLGRVHMYQIVNRLIERGLASYIVKNNVKYFSASDPEILLKDIQQKEQDLQKILPELKVRQKKLVPKTKVEIYRSREGINTILKMILKDEKPYFILGGAEEACTIFELENTIFVKRAEKLKLLGKILARKKDKFFISKNEDYRFIPEHLISSTTQMMWGNKTAIFVWSEPYYAVLIDNEEITKSNLATFNYLWKTAEIPTKFDKNKRKVKL
ncbi:MAG: helix-turn-helix domain-containing protein [Nanoarchaeota archaeon]